MYQNLFPNLQILETYSELVTYCKKMLDVVGFSTENFLYDRETKMLKPYIVNTDKKPILDQEWIR